MKAKANREGLLTAFQLASSVVAPRSPKLILRNVKLDIAGDGSATVMATDLELGIRYRISGVTAQQPGTVILPTSEFIAILRELTDETIELESTDAGTIVKGGSSRFELPGSDATQFPEFPDFGDEKGHRVKAGVLSVMIRRTVFAVAPENSRYALNSVLVEFVDGRANLVATDGKRLALMPGSATVEGEKPAGVSLLSPKGLNLIQKILLDPEEEIEIVLRSAEALVRSAKVTIYSRLVEGRFPRYLDVFPPPAKVKIPLVVSKFLTALRQAKIVTSDDSKGVEFKFGENTLTLESRASDHGQSVIQLPIGYDGDPVQITFDPQFLIDALRVLDPEEEISLELIDGKRAGVIKTRDEYQYVIMPLTRERERA